MMVAVISQAVLLKRVIEAIKENSGFGEINLECDGKGMQTQALGTHRDEMNRME